MTEKSARNPTPGSFPHTGSAPAAPPVRGQRGATSAERGAEARGRGAAAEAPPGSAGAAGRGREGGRAARGRGNRRIRAADPGERSAVGRAPPAAPRTAAYRRRGGRRKRGPAGGELRAAARPRAATSSAGESLPAVAPQPCRQPPPTGSRGGIRPQLRARFGGAEPRSPPSRRGGSRPGAVYPGGGRRIRRRGDTPGCLLRD
ncbi:serine/arginine repetitive matrix protein 3-like [Sylvia atricapilla]|uniref:serine/arginine repetitive matrix protein 3-like n=1 Tax=Sylvia atricapilla TaxID=48155 RepID=UPI003397A32F